MVAATATSVVYSYVRFSTPEQRKGTGQARQEKAAQSWCKKHGLSLCRNYADLGVSAFKGRNAEYGELARFLAAVEGGKIARGSTLLVENLDRLSRQNLNKAVELFLRIVNAGIRVVTLSDGKEYTAEMLELPELMLSLLIFARANDESKMKSHRKAASWRFKREAAQKHNTPLGGKTPCWIKVEDGRYVLVAREAERVRQVFADYIAGSGIYRLNKKYGIPKATLAWWLSNPAATGTLLVTEEGRKIEIPKHYPAIIDQRDHAIQNDEEVVGEAPYQHCNRRQSRCSQQSKAQRDHFQSASEHSCHAQLTEVRHD
jgi:DNA invertase Pin-like site-specific DNA recombinase